MSGRHSILVRQPILRRSAEALLGEFGLKRSHILLAMDRAANRDVAGRDPLNVIGDIRHRSLSSPGRKRGIRALSRLSILITSHTHALSRLNESIYLRSSATLPRSAALRDPRTCALGETHGLEVRSIAARFLVLAVAMATWVGLG